MASLMDGSIEDKKPTIAIYMLNETLEECARGLQNFLKRNCEITICNCLWNEICGNHVKGSIMGIHRHYLNCREKETVPCLSENVQSAVYLSDFDELSEIIDSAISCDELSETIDEPKSASGHDESFTTCTPISGQGKLQKKPIDKSSDLEITDEIKSGHRQTSHQDKAKSAAGHTPHHDAMIILGHSSVLLAEDDDFVAALRKINPTIVAFLGCCGGNSRYGPIAKISHLLDSDDNNGGPIVGFYQRRVYVNELHTTSLVIGLQYYLHILNNNLQRDKTHKQIARCAFGLSTLQKSMDTSCKDPTLFFNDSFALSLVQMCHKDCKLEITEIPLSCMQLALYSPIVVDDSVIHSEDCPPSTESSTLQLQLILSKKLSKLKQQFSEKISKFFKLTTEEKEPIQKLAGVKDKLDEICKNEIRDHQLHVLIPLIDEINFLKLTKYTIELLKDGDKSSWKKIDHLQFLIAVLRGHWGKNSFTIMKAWAMYHLVEIMKGIKPQDDCLHQYKLCCICFVLSCDDAFIRFVKPNEQYHQFGILACTIVFKQLQPSMDNSHIQIQDITADCKHPLIDNMLSYPIEKFSTDEELITWAQFYQHCRYIPDCVKLYNDNQKPWLIGNRTIYGYTGKYEYTRDDFRLAMGALSDYVKTNWTPEQINELRTGESTTQDPQSIMMRPISYCCQPFINVNANFFMNYIPEEIFKREFKCFTNDLSYSESKVMYNSLAARSNGITDQMIHKLYNLEQATQGIDVKSAFHKMSQKYHLVSSCRFMFVKFNNTWPDNKIEGILFYTETHYGHNLIDLIHSRWFHLRRCRKQKCTILRETVLRNQSYVFSNPIHIIRRLCKVCKYRMQEDAMREMIQRTKPSEFPFMKLGRLVLKYSDDHQLIHICLRPIPQ